MAIAGTKNIMSKDVKVKEKEHSRVLEQGKGCGSRGPIGPVAFRAGRGGPHTGHGPTVLLVSPTSHKKYQEICFPERPLCAVWMVLQRSKTKGCLEAVLAMQAGDGRQCEKGRVVWENNSEMLSEGLVVN